MNEMHPMMHREGRLLAQRRIERTDGDRLAFLDAHRVYLDFGKWGEEKSGAISFDREGGGWGVSTWDGRTYTQVGDLRPTLREAIDALQEALS